MTDHDTASPRQVVQHWLDTAVRDGHIDSYEAKRTAARCSWHQPMELRIGDETTYVQCRDVSPNGVGLVARRNLDLDQQVFIRQGDHEPWVKCRVAHVTRSVGAYKVGVELAFDFD